MLKVLVAEAGGPTPATGRAFVIEDRSSKRQGNRDSLWKHRSIAVRPTKRMGWPRYHSRLWMEAQLERFVGTSKIANYSGNLFEILRNKSSQYV